MSRQVCANCHSVPSSPSILWMSSTARATKARCGSSRKPAGSRSEEHTSELQSRENLVCRLLLDSPPPSSTLFPYTTLFRSHLGQQWLGLSQRGPVPFLGLADEPAGLRELPQRAFVALDPVDVVHGEGDEGTLWQFAQTCRLKIGRAHV